MKLKNLYIEPSVKTPEIDLNLHSGDLILSGKSIPENAAKLYQQVLDWVIEYAENPRLTTNLRLNLEYFNTSSSIWIAKIVKALCSIKSNDHTLMIHLYIDIEEFDNMDEDDFKDELCPIIDVIGTPEISIGIKVYGTDQKGEIIKDKMVFI